MSFPNVVIVGHVCIDHNLSEQAEYTGWGSSSIYMANYLQQTHALRSTIISTYGPDMLQYLPDVTLLPKKPTHATTLQYENDTRGGTRIWRCHNVQVAEPVALTPEIIGAISNADIIIVAPLLPNYSTAYVRELLGHADIAAYTVLCPQGYLRQIGVDGLVSPRDFSEAPAILPLFDLVIYSEEDHPKAIEQARQWKQLPDARDTNLIVTQGPKGASIVGATDVTSVPTTPIAPEAIVDSVGCGDVFAVTVAYAFWQYGDLRAAILAGHEAAADKLLAITVLQTQKA